MDEAIPPELRACVQHIVSTVRATIRVPIVLVTQVTVDRQLVLVNQGAHLPDPIAQGIPLSHSICQHVVAMNFPLVVDDALAHPLTRNNSAVAEFGVGAYLGAPLHYERIRERGALCAIDMHRRRWSQSDVSTVLSAARQINEMISGEREICNAGVQPPLWCQPMDS